MASADRAGWLAWGPRVTTRRAAAWLLIAGVAAVSYANTFHAAFHFDDVANIVENTRVRNLAAFRDLSGTRYVGFLTFAVNHAVGGLNPVGYHTVNLLVHIVNGGLVYTLVELLFRTLVRQRGRDPEVQTQTRGIALATALLFVAHPIQTQAVTYVVQRFTSLAALFYLLAVVSYLRWRLADPAIRSRYGWYVASLVATLLAMKTKEHTVTLPLMLLLVEGTGFGLRPWRKWRPLLPFVLLLPLIPASLPTGLGLGDERSGWARETTDIGRLGYLATQCRVLVTYLRLMAWPVGQNLDYDYPIAHSLLEPLVLASGLLLVGLLGLAIYLLVGGLDWRRLAGFGLAWFFLTVSVESSIIPISDVMVEHRMYLPSVGLLLAANLVGARLLARWRISPVPAVAAMVVVLAGTTYERNKVWIDEITLWRDVVAKSPQKARGHNGLGYSYLDQGRLDEATTEFMTAISLAPDHPFAYGNLGNVHMQQGRVEAAIREYQTVTRLLPGFAQGHHNLGNAYLRHGLVNEAIGEYQSAARLAPDLAEPHAGLGNAYEAQGRMEDAAEAYRAAIHLNANFASAHHGLANVYGRLGRWEDAIKEYELAIRLGVASAEIHYDLGTVYKFMGSNDQAREQFETALRIRPEYDTAWQALQSLAVEPP